MKNTLRTIIAATSFFIGLSVFAQAPQKFSYQAVIRNSSNQLISNQQVAVRISIIQGSESGNVVFSEFHSPTTSFNGLITIQIGTGNNISGSINAIDWANGPYFIQSETDPNGGNDYTLTTTSQLLSVPYALFSANGIAGFSQTGDTLFLGNGTHLIVPGISNANSSSVPTGSSLHSCGANNIHNPSLSYGNILDHEGNVYKTIIISEQEWMAEDLKVSTYLNGDSIVYSELNPDWQNLELGAYSYYNNNILNNCPYGKLYNYHAISDPRGVCPIGWHIPTKSDWLTLISSLDSTLDTTFFQYQSGSFQSEIASSKLKSNGMNYWINQNENSTNESGFSALPSGYTTDLLGTFSQDGWGVVYWSITVDTTIIDETFAPSVFNICLNENSLSNCITFKWPRFSIRCMKD